MQRGDRAAAPPPLRAPPHNFEAEMALLAALLANNRAYDRIADTLRPEHFADERHGKIYAAIAQLIEKNRLANPVTLRHHIEASGADFADLGGPDYLARLAANVVTTANAADYARTIRDAYKRRQLIAIGEDAVNDAYAASIEAEPDDLIDATQARLEKLRAEGEAGNAIKTLGAAAMTAIQLADEAVRRGTSIIGIPTTFAALDKKFGGLEPACLHILAGRPSMGKTSLALWIGYGVARWLLAETPPWFRERPKQAPLVVFFSAEMSAEQLGRRIVAPLADLSPFDMRVAKPETLPPAKFDELVTLQRDLARLPFVIDDTPHPSLAYVRARCRQLKRQRGLALVIIDHLGIMTPPKRENRVQEMSELTKGLKALAKDIGAPVVALHQLSRAVESRENKRPQLSDLRDSGTVEQDADAVMFVYREAYYLARNEPQKDAGESPEDFDARHVEWSTQMEEAKHKAEAIISKQRDGPVGTAVLHYDEEKARFSNLAEGEPQ